MKGLVKLLLVVVVLVVVVNVAGRGRVPAGPDGRPVTTTSPADFIPDLPTDPAETEPRHPPSTYCDKPRKNYPTHVLICHDK